MKRFIMVILGLFILSSVFTIDKVVGSYKNNSAPITVIVNEQQVDFSDELPYINKDSRTMVPIRFIVEQLNGEVHWNKETKSVHIQQDELEVVLPISKRKVTVNGKVMELDTEAVINKGRTFVPIRFVATVLGAQVNWDSKNMKVQIQYESPASPTKPVVEEKNKLQEENSLSQPSTGSSQPVAVKKDIPVKRPEEIVEGPDQGLITMTAYRDSELIQVLGYVLPENNHRGSAFWYTVNSEVIESELSFHVVYKQYVEGVPMTFDDPTAYVKQALEAKFGATIANQVVNDLNTGIPSGRVIQQSPGGYGFVEVIEVNGYTIQINYVDYKEDYHLKHADISVFKN